MANQATAKKGEEYEIDSKNRVLLERIKRQQEELTAEKQIANATGKTDEDILRGKNDNIVDLLEYRAKKVQDTINKMSGTLTDDPNRQEVAKKVLEKIVGDDELTTEDEKVKVLAKAAFGDKNTTENEIEAKKAVVSAKGIGLKDPTGVGLFKKEKLGDNLIEEGEKENGPLTDKEKGLLKRKAELMSGDGLENQTEEVAGKYRNNRGRAGTEFYRLRAITKIVKDPNILEENEEINKQLRDKIPHNSRVAAFDDVANLFNRNEQARKLLGTTQGGRGGFLMRFKMFFYRLSGGRDGIVQTSGGYITNIGGISANRYVTGSMEALMTGSSLQDSMGRILNGIAGKGMNMAFGAATSGVATKLAGGALGPAGLAAAKVLGALKKFFGNAVSKLGIGVRNGLGSTFDKGWSGIGKAAMGLGALLASIGLVGTATASTLVGGAVVGGVAGSYVYTTASVGGMVSELVTAEKVCDSDMEYVDTEAKPVIPCGEDMSQYESALRSSILSSGYQTRCAVVAAAVYMIKDFPYYVPYKLGGHGEYTMGIDDNWCGGAMDCTGFVRWCYRQGGFAITKQTSTSYWEGKGHSRGVRSSAKFFETNTLHFAPDNCGAIKERVQVGDIVRNGTYGGTPALHGAIIIGVDGEKLQIAQEGGYVNLKTGLEGVNTCFIDICTGVGRGIENGCRNKFDRVSLMDNFFDYYTSGDKSINGYGITPNSDTIIEFPESEF